MSSKAYYITVKCRDVPGRSLFIVLDNHPEHGYTIRGVFTYATSDTKGLTDVPVPVMDPAAMQELTWNTSSLAEVLNREVGIG
jgi:hypothetical protein